VRDLEAAGTLKRVRVPTGTGELPKLLFDRTDLDRLVEAWKAWGLEGGGSGTSLRGDGRNVGTA
jgi:hypothetical protein